MKKGIVFTLFILCSSWSFAQTRIGILAGAVFAKTSGVNSKGKVGGFAGLEADLKLSQLVSLRPQLKYIMKGESNSLEGKGTYNYLELPLNLVYYIPTSVGRISIGAGPVFDYMMTGTWMYADKTKETIDFEYDKVNRFDVGINAVGNLEVSRNLYFTLNYSMGMTNVWSAEYIGKNKNRAVSLGVGFMF